jgi:hypothetical protein
VLATVPNLDEGLAQSLFQILQHLVGVAIDFAADLLSLSHRLTDEFLTLVLSAIANLVGLLLSLLQDTGIVEELSCSTLGTGHHVSGVLACLCDRAIPLLDQRFRLSHHLGEVHANFVQLFQQGSFID